MVKEKHVIISPKTKKSTVTTIDLIIGEKEIFLIFNALTPLFFTLSIREICGGILALFCAIIGCYKQQENLITKDLLGCNNIFKTTLFLVCVQNRDDSSSQYGHN